MCFEALKDGALMSADLKQAEKTEIVDNTKKRQRTTKYVNWGGGKEHI